MVCRLSEWIAHFLCEWKTSFKSCILIMLSENYYLPRNELFNFSFPRVYISKLTGISKKLTCLFHRFTPWSPSSCYVATNKSWQYCNTRLNSKKGLISVYHFSHKSLALAYTCISNCFYKIILQLLKISSNRRK